MTMVKQTIFYAFLAIVGILTLVAAWAADDCTICEITDEGGIIESLSALFYFLGIICSLYFLVFKRSSFRTVLSLWVFFCFVFLGEETSWFQTIFNYQTPSWMASVNKQQEFNIHNLVILQGGGWVDDGSVNKFNVKMLFSSQNIFRMFYFVYFLIIPLLTYAGKLEFIRKKIAYPVPDWRFIAAIWITVFVSFGLSIISSEVTKAGLAEIREMFYAFFICSYLLLYGKSTPLIGPSAVESV